MTSFHWYLVFIKINFLRTQFEAFSTEIKLELLHIRFWNLHHTLAYKKQHFCFKQMIKFIFLRTRTITHWWKCIITIFLCANGKYWMKDSSQLMFIRQEKNSKKKQLANVLDMEKENHVSVTWTCSMQSISYENCVDFFVTKCNALSH